MKWKVLTLKNYCKYQTTKILSSIPRVFSKTKYFQTKTLSVNFSKVFNKLLLSHSIIYHFFIAELPEVLLELIELP